MLTNNCLFKGVTRVLFAFLPPLNGNSHSRNRLQLKLNKCFQGNEVLQKMFYLEDSKKEASELFLSMWGVEHNCIK